MSVIEPQSSDQPSRSTPTRPFGSPQARRTDPGRAFGVVGLVALAIAGCTTSGGGPRSSPSVVYEHERFGSPEIRTPQLRGQ